MATAQTSDRHRAGTLTVSSITGLSTRLRILLSGLAVAEWTGRHFAMAWLRTKDCAAAYHELFENDLPVHEARPEEVAALPGADPARVRRLLVGDLANSPDLRIRWGGWLHDPLPQELKTPLAARAAELLQQMRPIAPIQARIDGFRAAAFRPTMIGAHLRRGDLHRERPDVTANAERVLAAVDTLLERRPDAGIFLCTDDGAVDQHTGFCRNEGVRDQFRARYGERLAVTEPRSLDRRTPEAIQDALVDLWLLRCTDMLVGSVAGSFAQLAAFGRGVPVQLFGGAEAHAASVLKLVDRFRLAPLLRVAAGQDRGTWTNLVNARRLPRRIAANAANAVMPGRRYRRELAAIRRLWVDTAAVPEPTTDG